MKKLLNILKKHIALIIMLIQMLSLQANASDDRILAPEKEISIMVGPSVGIFSHNIGNMNLPNEKDCFSSFTTDSKIGITAGIKAFIPILKNFMFSPRLQFENLNSDFNRAENTLPIFGQNNQLEEVSGTEYLDLSLNSINIDLLGTYSFTDFGLYLALGPSFGLLVSKSYTVTSNLIAPSGVTYLDHSLSKVISTGSMTNLNSFLIDLRGGIGWNWQISDLIYINPELLYSCQLNKIEKDTESKTGGYLFSVSVHYSL